MEASFRLGEAVIHYYTLFIALAVILSAGWLMVRTPKPQRLAMTDTLLIALMSGLIVGRVVHVALNWAHFGFHTNDILNWQSGGLDWHGVLFGGLVGIWLGSRWRGFDPSTLIDRLTPAIPLIALAGWLGCWNFACHYGREVQRLVDYPPFMVWEAEDVFGIFAPRFHTQLLGTSLSIALLILVLLLFWRGWGTGCPLLAGVNLPQHRYVWDWFLAW